MIDYFVGFPGISCDSAKLFSVIVVTLLVYDDGGINSCLFVEFGNIRIGRIFLISSFSLPSDISSIITVRIPPWISISSYFAGFLRCMVVNNFFEKNTLSTYKI